MDVVRVIDNTIYPRKAVIDSRQAYRDYCTVQAKPLGGTRIQLTITARSVDNHGGREVILEFLNYLLDKSVELQSAS